MHFSVPYVWDLVGFSGRNLFPHALLMGLPRWLEATYSGKLSHRLALPAILLQVAWASGLRFPGLYPGAPWILDPKAPEFLEI